MRFRTDCRRFRGDMPCAPGGICDECGDYEPFSQKILIIKLGAIGDVMRTTPILGPLRESRAPCHITWVVGDESAPLLRTNPLIDRVALYGVEALVRVSVERFDWVISLDKHPGAAGLAAMARSHEKAGFVLDPSGAISYVGERAEYAYRLGLDDNLKFRENAKTYQEMTFEMLGLPWEGQGYILEIPGEAVDAGRAIVDDARPEGGGPVVGLFTGAGDVWPMKRWTTGGFAALADRLADELGARPILLGAQRDMGRNIEVAEAARRNVPLAPHDLDIMRFAGLVKALDAIVAGDTMGMHMGLALGVPTVALFGPTSAAEVEMCSSGRAIVPDMECSPCYRSACDVSPSCMELIGPDEVFDALKELLAERDD